jgi:hypothetical protein
VQATSYCVLVAHTCTHAYVRQQCNFYLSELPCLAAGSQQALVATACDVRLHISCCCFFQEVVPGARKVVHDAQEVGVNEHILGEVSVWHIARQLPVLGMCGFFCLPEDVLS